MANDKELIYGIDLGTTNSCIALVGEDGEPHVLENYEGFKTTPSVVYYDDMGNVLVGDEAKRLMNGDAEHTVAFIKREIGNKNYNREIYGEKISPLVISSMILKKMVADANDMRVSEGLEPIHKAVITVPAYFGSTECEITRQAGEFVEYEEVYPGRFYGTLKSEIIHTVEEGKNVVLDIDVKGGINVKKQFGDEAITIFIMPPSVAALRERLIHRGTDAIDVINQRVEKAEYEISFAGQYDVTIINDNLDEAITNTENVIKEFLEK